MRRLAAIGMAACVAVAALGSSASARTRHGRASAAQHVLLLSVDGLHQSDLTWWVRTHPSSHLAALVAGGVDYARASTPKPSDSFPGLVGQITGGNPRTTGIYYDDSYNRALLAPGSTCTKGQTSGLGTEVNYSEALDVNLDSIDAGFGLPNLYPGLPGSVLALPGDLATIDAKLINPANLPIDPATCEPVYPHQYLKVNTVFEVAHAAGMRTAWADKHAAYELVAGPDGTGVDDLFTPEINSSTTDPSLPGGAGPDWTTDNTKTQFYDAIKVQSIINEIDGFDHSGTGAKVGVPALFGMNFQSVSTGEKLPTSPLSGADAVGGYMLEEGRWVPGPVLTDALGFVDAQVGRMLDELGNQHLLATTTVILSAKHGQSPIDATALKRIDDGNIIDALNAAWKAQGGASDLVSFAIDDDAMLMWLSDRSRSAFRFAKSFLLSYSQPASAKAATDYDKNPIGFTASGLTRVSTGTSFFGVPASDARVPDLVGVVQHGVVYTGKTKKIAEHGGIDRQDRNVPIVIFGAGVHSPRIKKNRVETTEIAPTILSLLGVDPRLLQAVQAEGTPSLPGF